MSKNIWSVVEMVLIVMLNALIKFNHELLTLVFPPPLPQSSRPKATKKPILRREITHHRRQR